MAGISPAPHGAEMRPRMERPPFPSSGGWGMGNQHGATEVSGSEARPRLRALSGRNPALHSRSPRLGCSCAVPLLPSAGASPRAGHTLPSAFFFFLNKIITQFWVFLSLGQPRQNFQRAPPTPRGPPFPVPATPARTPPPTRDQLLCFLPGAPFSLAPTND